MGSCVGSAESSARPGSKPRRLWLSPASLFVRVRVSPLTASWEPADTAPVHVTSFSPFLG